MLNSTLVTGIWDLGRSDTSDGWSRTFDHYTTNFAKLLVSCGEIPMAIFIDPENEELVWKNRNKSNTVVYHHKKTDFSGNFFPFFDKVQSIRNSDKWKDQTGWLRESTQSSMEYYNPMIMSKMFLLNNSRIFNPFNTDYYFWIDGGITNTVHPGYFSHDKVIEKIEDFVTKFLFVCFPYESNTEIHGFKIDGMKKYCNSETVNRVARGGFFGGHKEYIGEANNLYYSLLNNSLGDELMGTEESIFTIMTYLDKDTYHYEKIEDNGLIGTFFENVKNNTIEKKNLKNKIKHENNDIVLYINTFNTPKQLQMLFDSFEKYDTNFISKTQKYLIDNSTDSQYSADYDFISNKYDLKIIRNGNMGVCGARQYCAEHFADLKSKYMFFFEDDMLLDLSNTLCSFGLTKNITNLYDRIIRLMDIEDYDFIKFSFSEFYGHNGDQWSWHNVPQHLREEYFNNSTNRPKTLFHNIKTSSGLAYADGEIYYSNWPHIIGQEGNKKLFLDTKWDRPYEQTWMSHIYTLTKQNKVKPAILLSSPITHNRIYFYEGKDRKES
jgi:hypothetical protein